MDIIIGKRGSFFLTKDNLTEETAQTLSGLSFKDFRHYAAWFTLQKISPQSAEQYAKKNNLDINILNKFSHIDNSVYYKATEDLISFFENDNNFHRFRKINCLQKGYKQNFSNDFKYKLPKFNFAHIHDNFYLLNKEIPKFIKKAGISIRRIAKTYLIQYNPITHKVHFLPTFKPEAKSINTENVLYFYENNYVFFPEDWRIIQRINKIFTQFKKNQKKFWFGHKKDDDQLIEKAVKEIFHQPFQIAKYQEIYKKYLELCNFSTDYKSRFIYECHKIRNRILVEGRLKKITSQKLLPKDIFILMVENERSANLALTFARINNYWRNHDYTTLCSIEPCLKVLKDKTVPERENLLSDIEYVTKLKIQHWMDNSYESCRERIYNQTLSLIDISPMTKTFCNDKKELELMISMMYSLKIYNPTLQKYLTKKVNQYINVNIEMSNEMRENLTARYNLVSSKQTKAKNFLKTRYGFTDDLIEKAAKIYNQTLKI